MHAIVLRSNRTLVRPTPVAAAPRRLPATTPRAIPSDDPFFCDGAWRVKGRRRKMHTVRIISGSITVDDKPYNVFKRHGSRRAAYNRFCQRRHLGYAAAGLNKRYSDIYDAIPPGADILGDTQFTYDGLDIVTYPGGFSVNGKHSTWMMDPLERTAYAKVQDARSLARLKARGEVAWDISAPKQKVNVYNQGIHKHDMNEAERIDYFMRNSVRSMINALLAQQAS